MRPVIVYGEGGRTTGNPPDAIAMKGGFGRRYRFFQDLSGNLSLGYIKHPFCYQNRKH